ncbi:hypothetical protein ABE82_25960 (plasmid) [Paenibacillus peoriae]|uniref:hypothetical protein n=1 Tax=Paenibacillus peoriae TaxID=59893 RepID=UPI0007215A7D|nr:hypothetical protein [Paenibacillus peoriae]ALS09867.1 hypothetical protein ABE82_25960 [Paenibacillus peoriae]
MDFDLRFRLMDRYAGLNGFGGAFPNFHQANYGNGVVFGVKLIKPEIVEMRSVLVSELGDPPDNESRFRAIHDYANRNDYGTGFPNFHQAKSGDGVVYEVVLFKPEAVEIRDVLVSELDPPPTTSIPTRPVEIVVGSTTH